MATLQQCEISFRFDGKTHNGTVRIEQTNDNAGRTRYKARIESTPLHGTHGVEAESRELALDFLNLAMQAEGADEIKMVCGDSPSQAQD